MSNTNDDQAANPFVRVLFGLLLAVYLGVMGLFKLLAGIFGFWVIVGLNVGIIVLAYWLNPTLGLVATYIVFAYWVLWLLLKLVFLIGGQRLEQLVADKLGANVGKQGRA